MNQHSFVLDKTSSRLYDRHQIDPGQLHLFMSTPDTAEELLGISAVERDTGLLKETLRVWERRYGFPAPLRDALGERMYPRPQVERLLQLRRLMDRGWRPGKLMALSDKELLQHLADGPTQTPPPQFDKLLACLKARNAGGVRSMLSALLRRHNLREFICAAAIPLCVEIGNRWARGELDIAQEHLFTEQMQNTVRDALPLPDALSGRPRILLTTFPDEHHTLGLLFAEALLAPAGAACTSLGACTPLLDISRTLDEGRFDILALSFSAAFPRRNAFAGLRELVSRLPAGVEIWAGSAQLAAHPQAIPGVRYLGCIEDAQEALAVWRTAHPDQS